MKRTKSPRIAAYILGYYDAMKDQNALLHDVPISDLSPEYLESLAIRANKRTKNLVRYPQPAARNKRDEHYSVSLIYRASAVDNSI